MRKVFESLALDEDEESDEEAAMDVDEAATKSKSKRDKGMQCTSFRLAMMPTVHLKHDASARLPKSVTSLENHLASGSACQ